MTVFNTNERRSFDLELKANLHIFGFVVENGEKS